MSNRHYQCNDCWDLCAILTTKSAKKIPIPVQEQQCILGKMRTKAKWTDKTDIVQAAASEDIKMDRLLLEDI